MEPKWFYYGVTKMPTTITLKNIPDDVYARLKNAAATHRRSLNSEAIVCLESALTPARISPQDRLERARRLRMALGQRAFLSSEVSKLKRQGRA